MKTSKESRVRVNFNDISREERFGVIKDFVTGVSRPMKNPMKIRGTTIRDSLVLSG